MRRLNDLHTVACGSIDRVLEQGVLRSNFNDLSRDFSGMDGGMNQQRPILFHVNGRFDIDAALDSAVPVSKEPHQRGKCCGNSNDCFEHKNPPVIDEGCVRASDSMACGDSGLWPELAEGVEHG